MTSVTFRVHGTPEPKGSTKAFARRMNDGKYRAVTTSDNPDLKRWEQTIRIEAEIALRLNGDAAPPFDGPVAIGARFGFVRPASVSVKKRPHHTVKPDADKLLRAAIDPLIGVFMRDDAQVTTILHVEKFYVEAGRPAFAEITVQAVPTGALL